MELRQYWAVTWRRKWLIAVVVAIAFATAWGTGAFELPRDRYRATATLFVGAEPGKAPPYPVEAIRTIGAARDALEQAGLRLEPSSVLADVRVTPRPQSPLVVVEVDDEDPRRAALLANAFAKVYVTRAQRAAAPDPRTLDILSQAHQELQEQAALTEASGLDPVRKQWELRWLQVRDDLVARSYSDIWLQGRLGDTAAGVPHLLEEATAPTQPLESAQSQQARTLGGIGGLGLLVAMSLAFLLEYVDDRIRTEADAERTLGLPVLATLPSRRRTRRATRRFVAAARRRDVVEGVSVPEPSPIPDPRLAEAFQSLRVQIDLAARERPLRTLLVTSPGNGGDKTVVTAYLGTVFAQSGRETVLVSADLHHPELEAVFALEPGPGLGDVAASPTEAASGLVHKTWVPNLRVVPAGEAHAHPADVLASPVTRQVLEYLREAVEIVIVEAPPVLAGAEAALLVPFSDGVVLVIEAGVTGREQALAAKTALEKVRNGAMFLGVVLTNTGERRDVRYGDQRRRRRGPAKQRRSARRGRAGVRRRRARRRTRVDA